MPLKTTRPIKPDRSRVDLKDAESARQWSKQLKRSVEEIAAAIDKVGDNARSVKKELGINEESEGETRG